MNNPPTEPQSEALRMVAKQLAIWAEDGEDRLAGRENHVPIRELHMELTHRCDLKCIMCHHWEMPFKDRASVGREMSVADIDRFISGSKRLGEVITVVVSGGEPFVRPDSVDVVELLRRKFPQASLGVLTNMWNTELVRRRLTEIKKRGVEGLWLGSSLDGVGPVHDMIRGQPGAFKGFEESLRMIRAEFPGTTVTVNFTITPKNHGDLWNTYRYCIDNGLGFGAQFVVNHEGYEAPERFEWTEERLSEVEAQIDKVLQDILQSERALERLVAKPPEESKWLWNKLLFWWYLRRHGRGNPRFFDDCMAGRRYAMLDPEGNLFFCPVNKHKQVGNVRDQSFDEVWESQRAEGVRSQLIPCQCRCWLNCIANPVIDRVMNAAMEGELAVRAGK